VQKRQLYVLAATLLVAVAGASYAFAAHGDRHGQGKPPGTQSFHATLTGLEETPAIHTTGSGEFDATLDPSTSTIHFVFTYSNLKGQNVPAGTGKILFAHVHFGQRNVAGGVSFFLCDNSLAPVVPRPCPDDTTGSGRVEGDITPANVIGPTGQGIDPGAFDAIVQEMKNGFSYANIHTTRFPSGEIRGQIKAGGHAGDDQGDDDHGEDD